MAEKSLSLLNMFSPLLFLIGGDQLALAGSAGSFLTPTQEGKRVVPRFDFVPIGRLSNPFPILANGW